MSSLERAYSLVRSGLSLLVEDTNNISKTVDDQTFKQANIIPAELLKYFVSGSGKIQESPDGQNRLGGEFLVQFPLSFVTDGTEDIESAYEYLENEIKNLLPQSGDNPGGAVYHSYATVIPEKSKGDVITVRCIIVGSRDI